jgi:dipeptidase D
MKNAFEGLTSNPVWKWFEALTQVPRPSGSEQKAIEFFERFCTTHGFAVRKDKVGNLVICVPGSKGREKEPVLVLQGHMDMVGEKNEDVAFNFETDPIQVWRDGDWLKARGTTLGADNGIGLALAMALATDPTVSRPPLEILCTVDEERGLTGAFNLEPGFVTGRRMINIDSEEEGTVFVGCAGGGDTQCHFPLEFSELPDKWTGIKVKVFGLAGGHSGLNIIENRANALKLLATILVESCPTEEFSLCSFLGGDKHNAIPREATAIVAGSADLADRIRTAVERLRPGFLSEYGKTDPKLDVQISAAGVTDGLSFDDSVRFLSLVLALPHGVDAMSRDIPGLVETSSNLAKVGWGEDSALVHNSSRSSVASALARMRTRVAAAGRLAHADVRQLTGYPGWQPNMDSALLAKARSLYEASTGKTARVTAIHAGLECGIIGEKYSGMDMISIGPDMHGVHSPDERLSIPSTERFYSFLKALVAKI